MSCFWTQNGFNNREVYNYQVVLMVECYCINDN